MWSYEHSIQTAANVAAIWELYSDVSTWPSWDAGIASISLNGPFVVGATGEITPEGQGPLPFILTEVTPNNEFADETMLVDAGIVIRFRHTLTALASDGTRITHRVEIDGPAADTLGPQIGPDMTSGIPETMNALAHRAMRSR